MNPNQPTDPSQAPPPDPGQAANPPAAPQPEQPQASGQAVYPANTPAAPQPAEQPSGQAVYPNSSQPTPTASQYGAQYAPPSAPKSRKMIFVAAAVVVVVAIGAASFLFLGGAKKIANQVASLELEPYQNTTFGFAIQTPKGWKTEETDQRFTKEVSFQEPVGDLNDKSEASKYYASMYIEYELAEEEFLQTNETEYFDDIKKRLQELLNPEEEEEQQGLEGSEYVPEAVTLESEESTTIDGLKAYKVKLKVTNFLGEKDSIGYEYLLFVFVDEKTQYEITMRAHQSESAFLNKADSILASFDKL